MAVVYSRRRVVESHARTARTLPPPRTRQWFVCRRQAAVSLPSTVVEAREGERPRSPVGR